jgi:hypothetical protein
MPPVGFETTITAGERPQTYALDRAATGTGMGFVVVPNKLILIVIKQRFWLILLRILRFLLQSVARVSHLNQTRPVVHDIARFCSSPPHRKILPLVSMLNHAVIVQNSL